MDLQSYFRVPVKQIEQDIFTVQNFVNKKNGYDSISKFYDVVVGSRLYNKIMWGNDISDYTDFGKKAVENTKDVLIDAGCGSLNFTLETYLKAGCNIILIDNSIEMLRICRDKLSPSEKLGKSIFCVHGDLLKLPLANNKIDTILSMGMMHLFENKQVLEILKSFEQGLIPCGKIYLSSLKPQTKFTKKYMQLLYKKGEVAKPREANELCNLIKRCIEGKIDEYLIGSMLYQTVFKA